MSKTAFMIEKVLPKLYIALGICNFILKDYDSALAYVLIALLFSHLAKRNKTLEYQSKKILEQEETISILKELSNNNL